jgi:hypothetical protein
MIEKASPPREISDSKHVRLMYDEESKILIQVWKDFVPSKVFRKAIDTTVAFTETNEVKGILSDALAQGVVSAEDAKYAADTIPTMYKNGLRAMAFVIPENIFTKLSLKKFEKTSMLNITQYFISIESAMDWIHKTISLDLDII